MSSGGGIPAVPLDVIDAIRVMEEDIDHAMIKVAERNGTKKVSMSMIIDYFFQQCGFPTAEWKFCDILFVRYFTKVAESLYVGKAFSTHAACFLMALCLLGQGDIVQLVIDVYSDGDDGPMISIGRCRMMLENMMDFRGGDFQRYCGETFEKFLFYIRSNPTISVHVNIEEIIVATESDNSAGESSDSGAARVVYYSDAGNLVPIKAVHAFFARKHKFIFWPLLMMKAQLQRVFMGEDFWGPLNMSAFFVYLGQKGVMQDAYWFTEVLQKMYTVSITKMKAQGTLAAKPFERKNQGVALLRLNNKKQKLPPEAYAMQKKLAEQQLEVMEQIKSAPLQPEEPVSREGSPDIVSGTVKPRSSKSGKQMGPSPLSGKYDNAESVSSSPPPLEVSSTSWSPGNYISQLKKICSSTSPPKPSKSPAEAQRGESRNNGNSFLPILKLDTGTEQPNQVGSECVNGSPRKSNKFAGASSPTSRDKEIKDESRKGKEEKPKSPKSRTLLDRISANKPLAALSALMHSSSSPAIAPSVLDATPPKPLLPRLSSKDDFKLSSNSKSSLDAVAPTASDSMRKQRHSLSSLPSPRANTDDDVALYSPRKSSKLSQLENDDTVTSPRRSLKLQRISSKQS